MTNSILITKYIRTILTDNEDIVKHFGDRIFAVDAKQGTSFPFAVIVRNGIIENTITKDGNCDDEVSVQIIVVDDNYIGSVTGANLIRNQLEGHRYQNEDINIYKTRLETASETFYNNAFLQILDLTLYCRPVPINE